MNSRHKSLSELAALKLRQAHEERVRGERYGCGIAERFAEPFQKEADALLTLPGAPDVGPGGEVVNTYSAPTESAEALAHDGIRLAIRDTLTEGATRIAEDASIRRTDLLLQPSSNALAMGIDAADSIQAANSLEKMLAHQIAVAHEASLRLMDRALSYEAGGRRLQAGDSVEACRLANAAARLMSVYQDAVLTLQKLRTGGNQTVTVQHVTVAPGGQAVIGNVQTGEAKRRGNNGKAR